MNVKLIMLYSRIHINWSCVEHSERSPVQDPEPQGEISPGSNSGKWEPSTPTGRNRAHSSPVATREPSHHVSHLLIAHPQPWRSPPPRPPPAPPRHPSRSSSAHTPPPPPPPHPPPPPQQSAAAPPHPPPPPSAAARAPAPAPATPRPSPAGATPSPATTGTALSGPAAAGTAAGAAAGTMGSDPDLDRAGTRRSPASPRTGDRRRRWRWGWSTSSCAS
jgi:hypothetical protein